MRDLGVSLAANRMRLSSHVNQSLTSVYNAAGVTTRCEKQVENQAAGAPVGRTRAIGCGNWPVGLIDDELKEQSRSRALTATS